MKKALRKDLRTPVVAGRVAATLLEAVRAGHYWVGAARVDRRSQLFVCLLEASVTGPATQDDIRCYQRGRKHLVVFADGARRKCRALDLEALEVDLPPQMVEELLRAVLLWAPTPAAKAQIVEQEGEPA